MKLKKFVLLLLLLSLAPIAALANDIVFNMCLSGPAPYNLYEHEFSEIFVPLAMQDDDYGTFYVLDCEGDENLHIVKGNLPQTSAYIGVSPRGRSLERLRVLRSVHRTAEEARFLSVGYDLILPRQVAAPAARIYPHELDYRPDEDNQRNLPQTSDAQALNGDYYTFFIKPSERCVDGELFVAQLRSSFSYNDDENSLKQGVYEPGTSVATGYCWPKVAPDLYMGCRNDEDVSCARKPHVLDYQWTSTDEVTLLVNAIVADGSRENSEGDDADLENFEEALLAVNVNVAQGTARLLFDVKGVINGVDITPGGCGQYMLGARIAGNHVFIAYRTPRLVMVNASNPEHLTAEIAYVRQQGAYTCEGGESSFDFGRAMGARRGSYDSDRFVVLSRSVSDSYFSATYHTAHWFAGEEHVIAYGSEEHFQEQPESH